MSASRRKGTAAETAVVNFLRPWFPWADRVPLSGARDRGDVTIGPGGPVHEVKDCAKVELGAWLNEAHVEARNAGAPFGVVWFKRRGKSNPGDWYVLMDGHTYTRLLHDGGYGVTA